MFGNLRKTTKMAESNSELSTYVSSSSNYPSLQEFQQESKIGKLIPGQAQKGLFSFNVYFTCIDVADEYIAIGTNVGVLYLYDRKCERMHKLRNENYRDSISSVKLVVSLECLVAFGCQSGLVLAFKVPFDLNTEVEKFTVQDLHQSPVTAIEWARNGLKFFTGDQQGVVVCTEIDHMEHQSRSRVIQTENNEIIQLSYNRLNLLISTLDRSVLYNLKDDQLTQIGLKSRKSSGRYGAIFLEQTDNSGLLFASRQGQRLWKSDVTGVIHETIIFKSALTQPHSKITLLTPYAFPASNLSNFQFGPLKIYDNKYILVWSDFALVLIDPEHQAVVASCCDLYPIIDVATCGDEIFVVRGQRHLVRIATEPEKFSVDNGLEEASVIDDILVPFKELKSALKERSESLSTQKESSGIFSWMRRNRSASEPNALESKVKNKEQEDKTINQEDLEKSLSDSLPHIEKLDSNDYIPVHISPLKPILSKEGKINTLSKVNPGEDIVFKPRKKNKKNKKVRFSNDAKKSSSQSEKELLQEDNKILQDDDNKHDPSSVSDPSEAQQTSEENNNPLSTITLETNEQQTEEENNNPPSMISVDENDQAEDTNNDLPTESLDESNTKDRSSHDDVDGDIPSRTDNSDVAISETEHNHGYSDPDHDNQTCLDEIYSLSYDFDKPDGETKTESTQNDNEELSEELLERSSSEEWSLEIGDSDPPKYGLNWVEYKGNEVFLHLSISNKHIFWADVNNNLHISNFPVLGLEWTELQQPSEKVAVSPSEMVLWVLYKGTVYAALQKGSEPWSNVEWVSIARDIVFIAVDDGCGWYVHSSGKLLTQQNLSASSVFNYPQSIHCPLSIDQVACRSGVLWVLTTSGHLYYRADGNENLTSKSKWNAIEFKEIPLISNIHLGTSQTGWIVDNNGCIWFLIGVTASSPEGIGRPWQVESSSYLQSISHLTKTVMNALNGDLMKSILKGGQQICIAASEKGVWFLKTLGDHLYCNQNRVIGHLWQHVIPVGTASATKWSSISAKGVLKAEGGVWCMTNTNDLLCLCPSTHNPFTVDLPCAEEQARCIESMPRHLWLLTSEGSIFVRRGITSDCLHGVWWQPLDLSQLNNVHLCHISCSRDIVWACCTKGNVFVRMGLLNPSDHTQLAQAWIPIDSEIETSSTFLNKLSSIGKRFPLPIVQPSPSESIITKVYVGPQSYMVWALDDRGCIYVREGVTFKMPIGEKWTLIPELSAKELCISSTAVWVVKRSGKIYRRFGISERNLMGDYWKLIPGNVDHLSATLDDDLWGLHENGLFYHTSFALDNTLQQDSREAFKSRSISEEDWEDIMTDSI